MHHMKRRSLTSLLVSACICWYCVSICMYLLVSCQYMHVCVAITRLRLLHQKCLSMKCRYVHVCECLCQYLHAASHSCRGLRHHSPNHAWPQGRVLRTGRVRLAWRARLRQPPVLHQHVGHGLAHGLPGCRPFKN